MAACPECGCSVALHFADGCHRAYGFLCKCKRTRKSLDTKEDA